MRWSALLLVLLAAGCGFTNSSSKTETVVVTKTVTHTAPPPATTTAAPADAAACTASDLSGTFSVEPGSAGAGNIVYALRATNGSQGACTVSGFPTISFLDSAGHALPSKTSTTNDPLAVVTLEPGDTATSEVRFSPNVDPCDPGTATTLRVELPDRTTFDSKIDPTTKLCGAGSLQPSPWGGAS